MNRSAPRSALVGNVILAISSILFALLMLAALEGVLRVAGIGSPDASNTSRLKYQQVFVPLLEPAARPDGTPTLQTVDQRLAYQSTLRDKPEGAITVAMFGGSAAAGLGFSPNATIARHLEVMLRRANPGRVVDVLNFGIVALSSKQVKVLVADVSRRFDVDLIVVYSGNNEFLEIHAEKYANAHASWWTRMGEPLTRTHLYRLANRAIRGAPRQPSLADMDFSSEDLRVTQRDIVRDIEMTTDERDRVVDVYRANIEGVAQAASTAETPVILMAVASNWKWRGREDLPQGWEADLLEGLSSTGSEREKELVEVVDRELEKSPPSERHEWLFRRATLAERAGDFDSARVAYRAAFNEDPHLRRALDEMNDAVDAVAREKNVVFFDTVAFLSEHAENGIIGFDEFYDYVHFTPHGAVLVATALFELIEREGIVENRQPFDVAQYRLEEIEWLDDLDTDDFAVERWVGFGFDRAKMADRDLWKYDELLHELDERIEKDPKDVSALVYRGNIHFFRLDGAAQAERDYRAAMALEPTNPAIRSNLERLSAERGL